VRHKQKGSAATKEDNSCSTNSGPISILYQGFERTDWLPKTNLLELLGFGPVSIIPGVASRTSRCRMCTAKGSADAPCQDQTDDLRIMRPIFRGKMVSHRLLDGNNCMTQKKQSGQVITASHHAAFWCLVFGFCGSISNGATACSVRRRAEVPKARKAVHQGDNAIKKTRKLGVTGTYIIYSPPQIAFVVYV
jgi:hypothetical protein